MKQRIGKEKTEYGRMEGLGYSETARYYAIKDLDEAKAYMEDCRKRPNHGRFRILKKR